MRRGYSSWEVEEEQESEEVDILLMNRLDVLANGIQKEGERSFWELLSRQIILIPFKEFPSPTGLVQTVIQSPRLFHFHVFEGRERQCDHSWNIHR